MDWLRPIEERVQMMEMFRLKPGEQATPAHMLAADARKLLAAVRLGESIGDQAQDLLQKIGLRREEPKRALDGAFGVGLLLARLRSGDVEEKP